MQREKETAGTMEKRRSKRSTMTDRGMVSLLAAVEVASNNSPGPSDQLPAMANPSQTPDEPRKGARVFSAEERATLEAEYAENKFPTRAMMVEFATKLSKPPEKVRTWFNNRRALDRKMGVSVIRHPVSRQPQTEPAVSPQPSPSPAPTTENPNQNGNGLLTPAMQTAQLTTPNTPTTPLWPTKITPVTASRRLSIVTPIPPTSTPARSPTFARSHTPVKGSSSRVRLSPARLRKVRLRLGQTELHGEGHPNELGLEVKFLFGKKRLVYEWYCGKNYSEAAVTGGPYAKIEINFDSLFSMAFERTRDGSVIRMTLSDSPALYRQTEHNMHKFKVRAQQRQYQRATPDQFEEDVSARDHQILLRSDEAARVKKSILESVPELACLVQTITGSHIPPLSDGNAFQNDRLTDTESVSAGARTEPVTPALPNTKQESSTKRPEDSENATKNNSVLCTPRVSKRPSEPSSAKSDARTGSPAPKSATSRGQTGAEPDAMKDTTSKPTDSVRQTPMTAPSRAHVWETPTRSNMRRGGISVNEQGAISNTANAPSGSNAAFLFPTPGPWQSPATPFGSDLNTLRGANVNFWLSGGPPSVGATPLADSMGSGTTPVSGPVRRALDFTPGDFRGNRATNTPTAGRKRRFTEINDENDASVGNKQTRLNLSTPLTRKSIFPPPPMPPPLPPPPPPPLPTQRLARVKDEPVKAKKDGPKASGEEENKSSKSTTTTLKGNNTGVKLPR